MMGPPRLAAQSRVMHNVAARRLAPSSKAPRPETRRGDPKTAGLSARVFECEQDFKMKAASSEQPPESLGEDLGNHSVLKPGLRLDDGAVTRFRDGDFELGDSPRTALCQKEGVDFR